MKAEDTVLNKDRIEEIKYLEIRDNPEYHDLRLQEKRDVEDRAIAKAQAKVSFPAGVREGEQQMLEKTSYTRFQERQDARLAGMRKVADWVDEHRENTDALEEWEAQLRDWGVR